MPPHTDQTRWFAEHLQPHGPALRAWLAGRFAARLDLEDIVQEALVRTLRAHQAGTLRAPRQFLYATARNLALDRARRHGISHTESLGEIEALNVLDEGTGIPETVARHQELALLTEAIQSLPPACRRILTLRKLYGLSQGEIAVRLGLSEKTVSNQIAIGIDKCTDWFASRGLGKGAS
jgi:RNA polymerase sigma-70 factor (ECF subfamily)